MPDFRFLEFPDALDQHQEDISRVLADYLKYIVNKKLRLYKQYLHTEGPKQGQSLFSHVMDLVTFVNRLTAVLELTDEEQRCVYLALTVHDLNKIPEYGLGPGGRELNYAEVATPENIQRELQRLEVSDFFPAWQDYLLDIVFLAHAHNASLTSTLTVFDQAYIDRTRLQGRLKGPLKQLMQAADTADNSHSSDHRDKHEVGLRDRLLIHINGALGKAGRPYEYRFVGHRLAELRGIFTNVIHNEMVRYFRDLYGEQHCIDAQYYPDGVNYLFDRRRLFEWSERTLREVAGRIEQRLAAIQLKQLEQFVRSKPSAITVDAAALRSGASLQQIFEAITRTVMRKQYNEKWRTERNTTIRGDLEAALAAPKPDSDLPARLSALLEETDLLPGDEEALRRGEFAAAYRKFLDDHRSGLLKAIRADAWTRIYRLFALPEASDALYRYVYPYRRGYMLARDLPALHLDEMKQRALEDLAALEIEAAQAQQVQGGAEATLEMEEEPFDEEDLALLWRAAPPAAPEQDETELPSRAFLVDYLQRHLSVWDSAADRPLPAVDFAASLRQYTDAEHHHQHCCHCGTPLEAGEWMAMQVPPSIGVQNFSNRLEGGSPHDPKRNVCEVCRTQFILEKLAWHGHRDKQSAEQVTFYLHLFPYAFFTRPLLRAWWYSVRRLADADHTAFFLDTRNYFRLTWRFQTEVRVRGFGTRTNGMNLSSLSEAISTTPIFPLVAPGENYGLQFLLALEKAVVLVRWFECRALLSRSPVPPLNLAHERIDGQPVVLMVEGAPRTMNWLVPQMSLPRGPFETLVRKLTLLHQLSEKLFYVDAASRDKTDSIPHDFAVAAADDPLALYYVADRTIEKKVAAEKGGKSGAPELRAIFLSRAITPILDKLITL